MTRSEMSDSITSHSKLRVRFFRGQTAVRVALNGRLGQTAISNSHFKKMCVFLSQSRQLSNDRSVNSQKAELTKRPFEALTDFAVFFLPPTATIPPLHPQRPPSSELGSFNATFPSTNENSKPPKKQNRGHCRCCCRLCCHSRAKCLSRINLLSQGPRMQARFVTACARFFAPMAICSNGHLSVATGRLGKRPFGTARTAKRYLSVSAGRMRMPISVK
jgi:hypothetical protein